MTKTFDWRPRFDGRSLGHLVRGAAAPDELPKRTYVRARHFWLDQGAEGACTGFGTAHTLGTAPRRRKDLSDAFARDLYYEARREDEYPGEAYDGSSVLGAMRAAKTRGYIGSYSWATTIDEVVHALGYVGAVTVGVSWMTGMVDPDSTGWIRPSGSVEGGHCVCLAGVDLGRGAVWVHNSWGRAWGLNGGAWLGIDDLAWLLAQQGEAAVPVKV